MNSKQEILERIYEDWGQNPQSGICAAILDYLLRINMNNPLHITYGSLRKVVKGNYQDKDLLEAVQYLCGERTPLLEAKFELIDNDHCVDIANCDINYARRTGSLYHPDNGELVEDFENKVFIYFQPSNFVRNILIRNEI